jgi:hypothetical protein
MPQSQGKNKPTPDSPRIREDLAFDSPQEAFEFVRMTFFPKWDRQRRWKLRILPRLRSGCGKCLTERQIIVIAPTASHRLLPLIIHEICHAAAAVHHGQRWKRRVLKAADTAAAIGLASLAEELRKDTGAYGDEMSRLTAAQVYTQIEDAVITANELPSFKRVAAWVRSEYNFTPSEFHRRFRRAAEIYRKACLYRAEKEAARAKFRGQRS